MHLGLIADQFSPSRSSCAVQMGDLAQQLAEHGVQVTVCVPAPDQAERWRIERMGEVQVVRLRAPQTRDLPYPARVLGEFAMPYAMLRNLKVSTVDLSSFDGIVSYSPSIFLAPLVRALKEASACLSYLILRDVFPDWAADVGLMKRRLAFRLLSSVARYQYRVADVIGVQTPANIPLIAAHTKPSTRLEVLQNWLRSPSTCRTSIDLSATALSGRTIFVYAGNMGVAQGMEKLLRLAAALKEDPRAGFVFVGRGSEAARLEEMARRLELANILFFQEIEPEELVGLFAQAHVGLVSLAHEHKTHNIPGKFVSYMHAGLPVLASLNPGNDLIALIEDARVGEVSDSSDGADLPELARRLLDRGLKNSDLSARCRALGSREFSAEAAAIQIQQAFRVSNNRASYKTKNPE